MMNPVEIAQVCLLLPKAVVERLLDLQQVDSEHPRRFGLEALAWGNVKREEAVSEAKRAVLRAIPRDLRPVGMSAPDNVVWLEDMLRAAVEQVAFEITTAQDARIGPIRRKIAAWDDTRQCADDLGIRVAEKNDEAVAELQRVGLGWIVDAVEKRGGPRFGLPG